MRGETYTLTAVPDEGYVFTGWSGDASGDENTMEITIDDDKSITAVFDVDTGIERNPSVSEFVFYPNPLRAGNLAISTPIRSEITIYSITGNLLVGFDRVSELKIDRSGFNTVIYIIKVVYENQVKTGILMVQ